MFSNFKTVDPNIKHVFEIRLFTLFLFQYKERIPKYKKIEVRDNLSMTNFINEIQQMNIYNSLDANPQSSPNDNYEIFERLLVHARDKHLPIKKVKYCKNKHKLNKWITNGIL